MTVELVVSTLKFLVGLQSNKLVLAGTDSDENIKMDLQISFAHQITSQESEIACRCQIFGPVM